MKSPVKTLSVSENSGTDLFSLDFEYASLEFYLNALTYFQRHLKLLNRERAEPVNFKITSSESKLTISVTTTLEQAEHCIRTCGTKKWMKAKKMNAALVNLAGFNKTSPRTMLNH